ncbi:hypothetical protein FH5_04890 [Priestia endophytica]|nr:hypothetical protein FH5_04890 [Priestia endophytica]
MLKNDWGKGISKNLLKGCITWANQKDIKKRMLHVLERTIEHYIFTKS